MRRRTLAALTLALAAPAAGRAADRPTYGVDYVVRVSPGDPGRARVTWRLAGIDEIRGLRLVFRDDRTTDVRGTGTLVWRGRTLFWTPGRPYAHLRYTVAIDRRRPPGPHLDSHATTEWVATRALHLFPEINIDFAPGATAARARARLVFRLPRGWASAAAGAPLGPHAYRVEEPGKRFDRPRGWFLLGRIARRRRTIAGMEVTVAVAPGSALDARRLLRFYARTAPLLAGVLGPPPPRLLVVSAPDPMWHGGLSGEDSFFVNGHIPLASRDGTSTYLHELFHVWQPFRPGPDGRWITEGLAEYYSLALRTRTGRLSARGLARGVALFARYGRWGVDLSRTREPAALNNSAPLVMYALDGAIRDGSGGRRSLDDAVRALAHEGGTLTTARLLHAASRAAGRDLGAFFRRHVLRGEPPPVPPPAPAARSARLAPPGPLR
jgi:predicted metalloprotease with PDZ domain